MVTVQECLLVLFGVQIHVRIVLKRFYETILTAGQ